ncbi:MAG TPA: EAL domain-containing protein [Anaeromyxobacteraceae bacterium]|nr:EAL domain-containing protein [Anaeromyxobacteraceae bacterium]
MTSPPLRPWALLLALGLALAALAAARPLAALAAAAREVKRSADASALAEYLASALRSLPPPPPRCAAACLPGDRVAPPDAAAEIVRRAGSAPLLAGPAHRGAAERLGDVVGTALADPESRDPAAAEGLRLEAQALLAAIAAEEARSAQRAAEAMAASVPAALAAGAAATAALALGLLALGAAWRQVERRRRAEEAKATLFRAMEQVRDLVTIVDRKGRIAYVNKAVESATGYRRRELVGKRNPAWLPWYAGVPFISDLKQAVLAGRPYQAGVLGRRKTGEAFLVEERVTPLSGRRGELRGMLSTAQDVTERRLLERTLDHRAKHDPLTGLANRRYLARLLEQALEPSGEGVRSAAILAVDVDRFTQINDILGSAAGDRILTEVGHRLRSLAGPRDIAACLGGDSFALARIESDQAVDVWAAAEAVRQALSRIRTGDDDVPVTVSVGIALFPEHGRDARTLLERADLALGAARLRGRGAVQIFDERVAHQASEAFQLERRLAAALHEREYLVRYQPYVELATRRLAGVEALVTWRSSDLGTVPASRFVPLLEQTGLIVDVGRWVLETACGQARAWRASRPGLPISVNLSGAQLRHPHLVEMIADAVRQHELDPGQLSLEVTESVCLDDLDFAAGILRRLKDAGASVSVDDFGTGYSSLSYLKRLPVDTIKIDMSFVRDVARDQDAASIVSAITTLARNLDLRTIAEGVETEEQSRVLHLLRCDMGQGYHFSPAVLPAEMAGLLDGERPAAAP